MAFPTTYVFDRDGNVGGQPLLGGIDKEENLAALQKNIDEMCIRDRYDEGLVNPGFGGEVLRVDGCCCILFKMCIRDRCSGI